MKAILIDVVNQQVVETEISNYKEIYTKIGNGCTLFTVPVTFENEDALYVDDEGLLHPEIQGGFIMKDWVRPMVGNGVILGTDDEGESVDCKTTVDEIKAQIQFLSKDLAEGWKRVAQATPPRIYFS
jgi:hypothetical protein